MEATEFLGITFRSPQHMHWFVMSMGYLVIVLSCVGIRSFLSGSFDKGGLLRWGIVYHLFTSLSAVVITKFGTINGPVYSRDCIWFNALMAALYAVIWYVGTRYFNRKNKVSMEGG